MHEENVGLMVKRLFDADRVIHEQLLGVAWEPPTLPTAGADKSGDDVGVLDATSAAGVK
jgi:hypothetical protein